MTSFLYGNTLVLFLEQLLIIFLTTLSFGCIEKVMKEGWVLYDSFKRSFNLIQKFLDALPQPSFVVDHAGVILKANAKGKALTKLSTGKAYFEDLIDPKCKELALSNLKAALKGQSSQFEASLKISKDVYEPYMINLESISWKNAKCVVISCNNTKLSKTVHGLVLDNAYAVREKTESVCRMIEKAIEDTNDKSAYSKVYYEAKQVHYRNVNSLMTTSNAFKEYQKEMESFDITKHLSYFLDFYSIPAYEKGITLTLKTDPCFPKEITGEKNKFEFILSSILTHLIANTSRGKEIILEARLKNPSEDGLLLSFEFCCPISTSITPRLLDSAIGDTSPTDLISVPEFITKWGLAFVQCRPIIKWLKGDIEIVELSGNKAGIYLDIPFQNYNGSSQIEPKGAIGFFQTKKINQYTTQWTCPFESPHATMRSDEVRKTSLIASPGLAHKKIAELNQAINSQANQDLKAKILKREVSFVYHYDLFITYPKIVSWEKCVYH